MKFQFAKFIYSRADQATISPVHMATVIGFLRLAFLLGGGALAYQYLTTEEYGEKRYEKIVKKYMPAPPEIRLK